MDQQVGGLTAKLEGPGLIPGNYEENERKKKNSYHTLSSDLCKAP